jgi:ADP-ribose pyrophosphatase YjhB (NUDIX family)
MMRAVMAASVLASSASVVRGIATFPRAAVAVSVCRVREGCDISFLLVRRGRPPRVGSWSIPGGKIELGETTLAAAARELREETQLGSEQGTRFHPWAIAASDVITREVDGSISYHYVISQMIAFVGEDAKPVAGDDASGVKWVTIDDVEDGNIELGGNVAPIFRRVEHLIRSGAVSVADTVVVDGDEDVPEYLVER